MVESPWRSVATPVPDREYPALISCLPLGRFRSVLRAQAFVRQVRAHLAPAQGLPYSMRATFRRK